MAIEKKTHFSIWYFVGAMLILMAFQSYFLSDQVGQLPYNEFKKLLKANQLNDIVIYDEIVSGKVKTGGLEGIVSPETAKLLGKEKGERAFYYRQGPGPRPGKGAGTGGGEIHRAD